MAGLLTKDRLRGLLLSLDTYYEESDVITAWGDLWFEFFKVASAQSTVATASYIVDETTVLKIGANSLLGSANSSGTNVVVTCNLTGQTENLVSQYDTQNFVRTTGLLGQTAPPSVNVNDYELLLPGKFIIESALSGAQSALESALVGVSATDAAAQKLFEAIEAWWADMEANPGSYFSGAGAIIPPPGLGSLQSGLQAAFDANNADIAANGNITNEQALDRVSQAFIDGNTGGIIEEGPTPDQFTIE